MLHTMKSCIYAITYPLQLLGHTEARELLQKSSPCCNGSLLNDHVIMPKCTIFTHDYVDFIIINTTVYIYKFKVLLLV